MKCRVDPQPIHGLASLSQGNLDVANEVSLRRARFGFFQICADCGPGLQQLVNEATYTWSLIKTQRETCSSTAKLERTIANVLGSFTPATSGCTRRATISLGPVEGEFRKPAF